MSDRLPMETFRNPQWRGLRCLRCDGLLSALDAPQGCPECAQAGFPAAMVCDYGEQPPTQSQPYAHAVSLGEGNTPCRSLSHALRNNSGGPVFAKLESANPTGSHKDRMAAYGVTHARALGKRGVIAASSGNAGLAIAAYAAAAGLACEIVITPSCPPLYRALMLEHGATVTTAADALARWDVVNERIAADDSLYALTNYVRPAVGSPAVTIEAYKRIAHELAQSLGTQEIGQVFMPTARGDLLLGLYLGFEELRAAGQIAALPKLIAVEPFVRLSAVNAGVDYRAEFAGATRQFSTSGATVTYQSVVALARTGGHAVVVGDARALAARALLAKHGWSVELCAAAAYAAYADAPEAERAASIIIFTAHGSRDVLSLSSH
jgi:threonine synthase